MLKILSTAAEDKNDPASISLLNLLEEPPEDVRDIFDKLTEAEEEPKVIAATDLTPDGQYGEAWLCATQKRVIVVNPDHGIDVEIIQFPLSSIEAVEKVDYVGNGALHIKTADTAHELVRFSLTLSDKFEDVRDVIEDLRTATNGSVETAKEAEEEISLEEQLRLRAQERAKRKGRCPKCGTVMPRWSSVCPNCLKKTALILRLFNYVKPYWKQSLISFAMLIVIQFIGQIPPLLQKVLIDDVFSDVKRLSDIQIGQHLHMLWLVVGANIAIHFVSQVLSAMRQYTMTWLGQRIIIDIRQQIYEHLHRLSMSFYDRKQTGQIMHRLTNDTANLQGFATSTLQTILGECINLILIMGIMFYLNVHLSLLTMIPVPFIVWGTRVYGLRMYRLYHIQWRKYARLSGTMADAIPGVRVVKAFTQENREIQKFTNLLKDIFDITMRVTQRQRMFYPTIGFITHAAGILTVWGYGGSLVLNSHGQKMTVGALMAFINYLWRFYGPVQTLSAVNDQVQSAATAAERVFELVDTKPDIDDDEDAVDLPQMKGDIKFENVSFSYEPGKKVLDDVNLEIKAGEMIGLVGHSGAGKTTFINLIGRFYDVKEGAIYIDGCDVRKVTVKSLRDQIGVVLQEPYLFHGTIYENIAYGKPDATMEEVIAAAKAANAHEFILRLSDGYDTMCGERGTRLSGGEKQRISIARAILKNPRILILDEATSSVDTETEAKIQEAINRLVKNRTTFAIAHRLSTLAAAHRLLVFEKGRLMEQGTHEELMQKEGGIFAKLVRIQEELWKARAI
jgi:ATP-binding cassette subfamily B protein